MLSKSCVNQIAISSAYCATCVLFDNAFGRSCIIMLNRIGAIIEPCGILITNVLLDDYVLPTRVQTHLSDKKFLKY